MRILVAHNFYHTSVPSGENAVVRDDVELLRASGQIVDELYRHSDNIVGFQARVLAGGRTISWPAENARLQRLLLNIRPDVIHAHNLAPLFTPRFVGIARSLDIPVVRTIHNYRISCIAGTHFRAGSICVRCDTNGKLSGVEFGCYRGSRIQSAVVTAGRSLHTTNYLGLTRAIALTEFMAAHLLRHGMKPRQVVVRPNPVPSDGGNPVNERARSDYLYAGRLDPSKGIARFVSDWIECGTPHRLRVIGAGPDRRLIEELARGNRVTVMDPVPKDILLRQMATVRAVVVPSLWYEGFPRVIAEAFSAGTPVIAADIGSLREIVGASRGWLVRSGARSELGAVLSAAQDRDQWVSRSESCLEYHADTLTRSAGLASLLSIYRDAISDA